MYNYEEMRAHVRSPLYLFRKTVESYLNRLVPSYVVPLYTMVSFTTIRYSEATRRSRRQGRWIWIASGVVLAIALGLLTRTGIRTYQHYFIAPPPPPPPAKSYIGSIGNKLYSAAFTTTDTTVRVAGKLCRKLANTIVG
ncbi:hypothetical protein BDF22DRAFT_658168 [Syncephalis plumigaleata]|nr:hypothetical protein BDF22DRAFT_658168 [Syncephalis plumigaleata]